MYEYVPYLSFLTSGIGILFIIYLLIRFHQYPKAYWLIGIIFTIVYQEFYIYSLTSKHIYQMLFLYRSPNFIRALLPIFLFFYVKRMLQANRPFKSIDYVHFVFPLIVTIGLMPDLMLSDSEKTLIFDSYYKNNQFLLNRNAGMFPPKVLQPFLIVVGILYSMISLGMIYFKKKHGGSSFVYFNKQNLFWLNMVSLTILIYFVLQLYQNLNLFFNHNFDPPSQIIKCAVAIFLFSYFIGTPNVQENMDGCIIPPDHSTEDFVPSISEIFPHILAEFQDNDIARQITEKLQESKCYVSEQCDLNSVAKIVAISPQKLSAHIKKFYGISFAEYINRLKIHHFLTNFNHFDHFTLETYIYQSGFKNRSTFYAAFKKYVGINPSFYLKEKAKDI